MHWSDLPNWLSGVLVIATVVVVWFAWKAGREARTALLGQVRLQRLVHASRLSSVLIGLARDARDEPLAKKIGTPGLRRRRQRPAMIPSLQAQLQAELAVFRKLGGPELPVSKGLAWKSYGGVKPDQATQPDTIRELAEQALLELQRITDTDDRLDVRFDEHLSLIGVPAPASKASHLLGRLRRTFGGHTK